MLTSKDTMNSIFNLGGDQGGFFIGFMLLLFGVVIFFLSIVLFFLHRLKKHRLFRLKVILAIGITCGISMSVIGSLLMYRTVVMDYTTKHNFQNKPNYDNSLLRNVAFYVIDTSLPLPTYVNLRHRMPAVLFQGILKSCGSNAISNSLKFHQRGKKFQPSRLFIHYNARKIDGTDTNGDSSPTIGALLQSITEYNACDEWTMPYDTFEYSKKSSKEAYIEAKKNRNVVCTMI